MTKIFVKGAPNFDYQVPLSILRVSTCETFYHPHTAVLPDILVPFSRLLELGNSESCLAVHTVLQYKGM